MSDTRQELFIPTEEERKEITEVCKRVVDELNTLGHIPKMAMALKIVADSFVETTGIKFMEMIEKDE